MILDEHTDIMSVLFNIYVMNMQGVRKKLTELRAVAASKTTLGMVKDQMCCCSGRCGVIRPKEFQINLIQ